MFVSVNLKFIGPSKRSILVVLYSRQNTTTIVGRRTEKDESKQVQNGSSGQILEVSPVGHRDRLGISQQVLGFCVNISTRSLLIPIPNFIKPTSDSRLPDECDLRYRRLH